LFGLKVEYEVDHPQNPSKLKGTKKDSAEIRCINSENKLLYTLNWLHSQKSEPSTEGRNHKRKNRLQLWGTENFYKDGTLRTKIKKFQMWKAPKKKVKNVGNVGNSSMGNFYGFFPPAGRKVP